MTRADGFTFAKKIPEYYSDFVDTFDLNPQTNLLGIVTNERSVIQSITNLVLTNKYERFYQPLVGSKVQNLNFEPNDNVTASFLQKTITETIQIYEPRAQHLQVIVNQDIDGEQISITVIFSVQNITKPISFTIVLPRVR